MAFWVERIPVYTRCVCVCGGGWVVSLGLYRGCFCYPDGLLFLFDYFRGEMHLVAVQRLRLQLQRVCVCGWSSWSHVSLGSLQQDDTPVCVHDITGPSLKS